MQTADKVQLKGHNIRVSYYIPGVRAINLYLKLLNENVSLIAFSIDFFIYCDFCLFVLQPNKGKGALLPDPPAPAVFQQLQNLAKQNPVCKYLLDFH